MRSFNVLMLIAAAAVAQVCATVRASELYGVGGSAFYRINQTNGAATLVGPSMGAPDMASDTRPSSFRIWVPDRFNLYTVNPDTGSTTLVGNFGMPAGTGMDALAFDATTSALFGMDDISRLYSINQVTGAATLIGGTNFYPYQGLACDNSGTLFGVTHHFLTGAQILVEIDRTTGAFTVRAQLPIDGITDIAVRPEDNVMFGVSSDFGTRSLYTINPTTGAMALVGPYGAAAVMGGLAFSPIPEPVSSSALALVGAALMRGRSLRRR